MRVRISGRHMETTDALKEHIETRLDKLRAHFERVIDAEVVLSVEKHRHIAEITLHANGVHIHGKESSSDMYTSVDAVIDKLDKQIQRFKKRTVRHQGRRGKGQAAWPAEDVDAAQQENAEEDEPRTPQVVRETLVMKPMGVDEAVLQLDLAQEAFLVFSNAQTQQLNVIYKREDGAYGLVEPAF